MISLFLTALPALPGSGAERWYKCLVRASSHTGHYTFRIDAENCRVYWREIDTQMTVLFCRNGIMKALKPSALSNFDIVFFNMNTGQFYDYLSGVYDRGMCKRAERP
ncbi:MAG TPA: hypothetical protein ENJ99_02050 [Rhizobiales bacterium]|nr:hypothetical protein [Hyphomicrobiales bacterium]